MNRAAFIVCAWGLFVAGSAYAQTQQIGFPPYGTLQHGEFDHVNLQNLNVTFSLPGVSVPGRGLSFSFAPTYNSTIWQQVFNGITQQWIYVRPNGSNSSWGWVLEPSIGPASDLQSVTCDIDGRTTTYVSNYRFQELNGTIHTFGAINYYDPPTPCFLQGPRTALADDGSGYYMDATSFGGERVYSPSGIRFVFDGWFDTNGNFASRSATGDWVDTANRNALKFVIPATGHWQYQYQDTTGAPYQIINLYLQNFNIKTNFSCLGVAERIDTAWLPISIIYPNGQQYSFTYEATPGNPGYTTARLQRVTLPTGGYYEYDYTGPNGSINCADGTTTQMTRVMNDGSTSNTWQYSRAPSSSNWVTTVTAPQLPYDTASNQTVYTFDANGHEISQKLYQGSATGTPVRTINTSWTTLPICSITPASRVTILEDGTTQSKTETSYDGCNGNLLSVKEYDWGVIPLRTTTFEYITDVNYTSRNIVNLLSRKTIYDGGGVVQYRQDIKYDETARNPCPTGVAHHDDVGYPCGFNYRGNATSVTTYKTPATPTDPIIKTFTYDVFGNVITAAVNCCQQKTFNYSAATNYAFPDSVVRGAPGTQLTTSATYNAWTGQVVTTTDENNQQTTYAYNDSMKRITSITRPDNAQITYSYDDSARTVTTNSPLQGTNTITQTVSYDTLGRPTQTAVSAGTTTYSKVKTTYDPLGRLYQTSNPFTGASPSYFTTNKYDALGRPTAAVLPDNGQTTYSYSTNTVTATDPALKQRKSQSDAAGRLVSVFEPDVTQPGNPLTQQTSYTYTVLDAMQTVTQGVQTRTYGYDNLGRLKSVKTPETNQLSTTYDYNDFDLPITRTDPRGVITNYGYDGLNRLYTVSYNVGTTGVPATATVILTYGTSAAQFNNGRLITITDGVGSEGYTYNSLGRMTGLQKVINGTTYPLSYAYNLAGELTSITYPSNRVVQQSVDAIGRLCEIAPSTTGCGTASSPYATGYAYNVANQATGLKYGNGIFAVLGYSSDRLQLTCLDYSTTNRGTTCAHDSTTKFGLTYSYGTSGSNNGQIASITDSVDNGRSATYTYDALYRLSIAAIAGSASYPAWGLQESYDRYGNRSAQSIYSGCTGFTCPTNSVTIDTATNRLSGSPYAYDLNGNMTNDGNNTLVYDGESRAVSASNGGSSGAYVYDGNSLRVKKCVPNCTSPTSSTVYIFSGSKVIAEYDNGTAVGSPSREYIYSGTQPLAKIDSTGTKYYHQDHLSNRLVTDSSGNTIAQLGHFPFGDSWYNASNDKFIFTTYERDSESGNDYAMMRYSVNRLGRFNSTDPIAADGTNPQSLNQFGYTLNDPLNWVDPLGLARCSGPECIEMEDANMGLRGRVGTTCSLDGMRTSCSLVLDLLQTGAGVRCPNNNCTGIRAILGPGGTTVIQQWIAPQTWTTGDAVTGYIIHQVIGGWMTVSTVSSSQWFTLLGFSNFFAGAGDCLTGRCIPFVHDSLTEWARRQNGADSVVNKDSGAYLGGEITGGTVGAGIASLAAANAAVGLETKVALHGAHHAFQFLGGARLAHLQVIFWIAGQKGSDISLRIPLPWR